MYNCCSNIYYLINTVRIQYSAVSQNQNSYDKRIALCIKNATIGLHDYYV